MPYADSNHGGKESSCAVCEALNMNDAHDRSRLKQTTSDTQYCGETIFLEQHSKHVDAMSREGRSLAAWIWRNFITSITRKTREGHVMGKDHLGTTYYEIPADPQSGKRRPSRWFQATEKEKFDQDIPSEWDAWLRGRRSEPPTQEEIDANNTLAQVKKIRAIELEDKKNPEGSKTEKPYRHSSEPQSAFPKYKDYDDSNSERHQKS